MPTSLDETVKVARLARLELTADQTRTLSTQLKAILDCFADLGRLNTDDVPPTRHTVEVETPFPRDVPGDSLPRGEALRGAPEESGGLFVCPFVVGVPGPHT